MAKFAFLEEHVFPACFSQEPLRSGDFKKTVCVGHGPGHLGSPKFDIDDMNGKAVLGESCRMQRMSLDSS